MTIKTCSIDSKIYQYDVIDRNELNYMAERRVRNPNVAVAGTGTFSSNICRKKMTLVLAFLIGFSICAWLTATLNPSRHAIHVLYLAKGDPIIHATDSKFLSIGLDSSVIAEGFKNFHMHNRRLKNMMEHLNPGYLRVGGTMADRLSFDPDCEHSVKFKYVASQDGDKCAYESVSCDRRLRPNFTLCGQEWLDLYELAYDTGFTVVFDLNALTRNRDGSWNPTNAERIIKFSSDKKMDVAWELGNEPNSFGHVFNYSVDAAQLAEDFETLNTLLKKYPRYRDALIVGPSVTRPRPENTESIDYLREFLSNRGGDHVGAITWHQYYFNGRTSTAQDFLNPDIFNLLIAQADIISALVQRTYPQLPIWLGETAAAYGGGAPGFTNRYIGTFIWLDKLGIAAKMGLDVVVRQSIFKGYYALIESEDYNPTPDYWVSVLHKRLVGPEVLPCHLAAAPEVRLYCHCTNKNFLADSAITVYGMNLKNTEVVIRLQSFTEGNALVDTIYAFVLTPRYSLLSKYIDLNKRQLELGVNGELPKIKPNILKNEEHIILPPYSTAFFIILTDLDACKS